MISPSHLATLLAAATPGPWRHTPTDGNYSGPVINGVRRPGTGTGSIAAFSVSLGDGYGQDSNLTDEDAALIVAAVNALPQLLAVFEAACAWRDAVRRRPEAYQQGVVVGLADALVAAVDSTRPEAPK